MCTKRYHQMTENQEKKILNRNRPTADPDTEVTRHGL